MRTAPVSEGRSTVARGELVSPFPHGDGSEFVGSGRQKLNVVPRGAVAGGVLNLMEIVAVKKFQQPSRKLHSLSVAQLHLKPPTKGTVTRRIIPLRPDGVKA